jgi:hypothetical protein
VHVTLRARLVPAAVLAAIALTATPAAAGKKECAAAYVDAQRTMKSGVLKKAREQLTICARDECMAAIRKDCVTWLDQTNANIPSIVAEAKGPDGKDTMDVRLFVDGELVAEKLDVRAVELEPGTHKLRFEMAGQPPVEQEVILRQGEHNRPVEASFAPKTSTSPTAAAAPETTAPATTAPGKGKPKVLPYVLGGVGVLALGGAGIFWYRAEAGRSTLEDAHCAPNCAGSDVSAIKRDRLVGDIFLGAGVVLVGLAAYFLIAPGKPEAKLAAWETWTRSANLGAGVPF